jgi:hypothetical protein
MSHRNEDDPTPREVERARRQLRRAGLGDLADDTTELAEVRELLPPAPEAQLALETDLADRIMRQDRPGPLERELLEDVTRAPDPRPGRWIGRTSGPDIWIPDEMQQWVGSGPAPGEMTGDTCRRLEAIWDAEPGPDAYRGRPVRAVPRPYGGRSTDPWGRAWCDCGEPVELHAHIPGSYTGAWCYAPREVRRPGERAHRVLRALALLLVGSALGLLILYAIVVGMVLNALSG